MTPKEKAKQLIEKFKYELIEQAKQYALIAVDEILDFILITLEWDKKYNGNVIYWQEVKQEINKL